MFPRWLQLALTVSIGWCACATPALAADLVIRDTAGLVRAISPVEEAGDIRFEAVNELGQAAEGVDVTLTASDGVEITGSIRGGMVVFEAVPAGTYTVSSSVSGITFTSVSIVPAQVAVAAGVLGATPFLGGGATTAIAGAALVAGGAVAISEATDGNGSGDDTPLSPFD